MIEHGEPDILESIAEFTSALCELRKASDDLGKIVLGFESEVRSVKVRVDKLEDRVQNLYGGM